MSVARFIADQRTMHQVPHTFCCVILGVSVSWFYKWLGREPTARQLRRGELDAAVKTAFNASGGTYGSPRIHADLVEASWTVSVNTVADSMRRQGLQGRKPKRRRGLTKQDSNAAKFPDLLGRDFTAQRRTPSGAGTSLKSPQTRASCTWLPCWICFRASYWPAPPVRTRGPNSPATRSRSQPRCAAAAPRSPGWCSTPIADRPTPQGISPACVSVSGCASPWAGSGRVSTMPPPRRSSPR